MRDLRCNDGGGALGAPIAMPQDAAPIPVLVHVPADCHLWTEPGLTRDALNRSLVLVKTYADDSHLIRTLVRCRECGHLYFHEFYEVVDWVGGNDAQYATWIPVDDAESADRLNALSSLELLQFTAIQTDFPSDAAEPTAPYWIVRGSGSA